MNQREGTSGHQSHKNTIVGDITSEKKRILAVPGWYPTKNDKVAGSFFKEQCLALSNDYDITVLTLCYIAIPWKKYELKRLKNETEKLVFNESDQTESYREYNAFIDFPVYSGFQRRIRKWFGIKKEAPVPVEGVGEYIDEVFVKTSQSALTRIIKKNFPNSFSLVYGITSQKIAMQVRMLAEICKVPYILGEHSPFPNPGQVINDQDHAAIENADCFLAISNDKIRQIMMQNIRLKRIQYIGNMIDDSKFTYVPKSDKIKTFLIVASDIHLKNYDMFIATMNSLKNRTDKEFKVMIVGYAANKYRQTDISAFEEKIHNSKFADCVTLIPEVERDKMPEIYHQADAFVMTSVQEGQPVSALEAACCGLPIFSTRCGGVEDYVDDEIGRLVSITDFQSLSAYLCDFLEGRIVFDNQLICDKIVSVYGKKTYIKNICGVIEDYIL